MSPAVFYRVATNAIAAGLLVYASLNKLVSPHTLAVTVKRTLTTSASSKRTLTTSASSSPVTWPVVVIAAAETITALLLVTSFTLEAGAVALLVFAFGIVLFAVLARLRHIRTACGCFGLASSRAPGWRNVLFGGALLGVASSDLAVRGLGPAAPYTEATLSGVSATLLLLTLFLNAPSAYRALRVLVAPATRRRVGVDP